MKSTSRSSLLCTHGWCVWTAEKGCEECEKAALGAVYVPLERRRRRKEASKVDGLGWVGGRRR